MLVNTQPKVMKGSMLSRIENPDSIEFYNCFFDLQIKTITFVRYITNGMKKEEVLTEEQITLARFAKAMGHPIRMYVLELLSNQSCCYSGDLTEVLPIAKSTLSQHLKELKEAGLIQGEIEAPRIKYCLNQENWKRAHQLFDRFMRQ